MSSPTKGNKVKKTKKAMSLSNDSYSDFEQHLMQYESNLTPANDPTNSSDDDEQGYLNISIQIKVPVKKIKAKEITDTVLERLHSVSRSFIDESRDKSVEEHKLANVANSFGSPAGTERIKILQNQIIVKANDSFESHHVDDFTVCTASETTSSEIDFPIEKRRKRHKKQKKSTRDITSEISKDDEERTNNALQLDRTDPPVDISVAKQPSCEMSGIDRVSEPSRTQIEGSSVLDSDKIEENVQRVMNDSTVMDNSGVAKEQLVDIVASEVSTENQTEEINKITDSPVDILVAKQPSCEMSGVDGVSELSKRQSEESSVLEPGRIEEGIGRSGVAKKRLVDIVASEVSSENQTEEMNKDRENVEEIQISTPLLTEKAFRLLSRKMRQNLEVDDVENIPENSKAGFVEASDEKLEQKLDDSINIARLVALNEGTAKPKSPKRNFAGGIFAGANDDVDKATEEEEKSSCKVTSGIGDSGRCGSGDVKTGLDDDLEGVIRENVVPEENVPEEHVAEEGGSEKHMPEVHVLPEENVSEIDKVFELLKHEDCSPNSRRKKKNNTKNRVPEENFPEVDDQVFELLEQENSSPDSNKKKNNNTEKLNNSTEKQPLDIDDVFDLLTRKDSDSGGKGKRKKRVKEDVSRSGSNSRLFGGPETAATEDHVREGNVPEVEQVFELLKQEDCSPDFDRKKKNNNNTESQNNITKKQNDSIEKQLLNIDEVLDSDSSGKGKRKKRSKEATSQSGSKDQTFDKDSNNQSNNCPETTTSGNHAPEEHVSKIDEIFGLLKQEDSSPDLGRKKSRQEDISRQEKTEKNAQIDKSIQMDKSMLEIDGIFELLKEEDSSPDLGRKKSRQRDINKQKKTEKSIQMDKSMLELDEIFELLKEEDSSPDLGRKKSRQRDISKQTDKKSMQTKKSRQKTIDDFKENDFGDCKSSHVDIPTQILTRKDADSCGQKKKKTKTDDYTRSENILAENDDTKEELETKTKEELRTKTKEELRIKTKDADEQETSRKKPEKRLENTTRKETAEQKKKLSDMRDRETNKQKPATKADPRKNGPKRLRQASLAEVMRIPESLLNFFYGSNKTKTTPTLNKETPPTTTTTTPKVQTRKHQANIETTPILKEDLPPPPTTEVENARNMQEPREIRAIETPKAIGRNAKRKLAIAAVDEDLSRLANDKSIDRFLDSLGIADQTCQDVLIKPPDKYKKIRRTPAKGRCRVQIRNLLEETEQYLSDATSTMSISDLFDCSEKFDCREEFVRSKKEKKRNRNSSSSSSRDGLEHVVRTPRRARNDSFQSDGAVHDYLIETPMRRGCCIEDIDLAEVEPGKGMMVETKTQGRGKRNGTGGISNEEEVVPEKPKVITEKPKLVIEKPNQRNNGGISKDEEVIFKKSKTEKPQILSEKPQVLSETPQVLSEKQLLQEKLQVLQETPQVLQEEPQCFRKKTQIINAFDLLRQASSRKSFSQRLKKKKDDHLINEDDLMDEDDRFLNKDDRLMSKDRPKKRNKHDTSIKRNISDSDDNTSLNSNEENSNYSDFSSLGASDFEGDDPFNDGFGSPPRQHDTTKNRQFKYESDFKTRDEDDDDDDLQAFAKKRAKRETKPASSVKRKLKRKRQNEEKDQKSRPNLKRRKVVKSVNNVADTRDLVLDFFERSELLQHGDDGDGDSDVPRISDDIDSGEDERPDDKVRLYRDSSDSEGDGNFVTEAFVEMVKRARRKFLSLSKTHKKLSNLSVEVDWKVAPAHRLGTTLTCFSTRSYTVRRKDLRLKTGPFSASEDRLIRQNFVRFCELHGLEVEPEPFLTNTYGGRRLMLKQERAKFVQHLARGLDDRRLYCVFKRFQALMRKTTTGRFTDEEDAVIRTYCKKFPKDPNKSWTLSLILNRAPRSIYQRITILHRKKWKKLNLSRQYKKFVRRLMRATKTTTIEELRTFDIKDKHWSALSDMYKNYQQYKFRVFWLGWLYPRLYATKPINKKKILCYAVNKLYDDKIRDYMSVDWAKLSEPFEDYVTPMFVKSLFQKMVRNTPKELRPTFRAAVKYLREIIVDKRLKEPFVHRVRYP